MACSKTWSLGDGSWGRWKYPCTHTQIYIYIYTEYYTVIYNIIYEVWLSCSIYNCYISICIYDIYNYIIIYNAYQTKLGDARDFRWILHDTILRLPDPQSNIDPENPQGEQVIFQSPTHGRIVMFLGGKVVQPKKLVYNYKFVALARNKCSWHWCWISVLDFIVHKTGSSPNAAWCFSHRSAIQTHTLAQTCLIELWCGMHRTCKNTPASKPDQSRRKLRLGAEPSLLSSQQKPNRNQIRRRSCHRHSQESCVAVLSCAINPPKIDTYWLQNRLAGSGLSRLPCTRTDCIIRKRKWHVKQNLNNR